MRYRYTVTIDDFECECADVKGVVQVINERSRFAAVTKDMVNSVFSRPHRANKRLFKNAGTIAWPEYPGQISIERTRLPSKGEIAHTELAKVQAATAAMTAS